VTVELSDAAPASRDHLVRFYERDADLVDWVGGTVLRAVGAGEAAVVIASEEHRHGFEAYAASAGIELSRARREGRYADLDARETLTAIMPGGRLDRDAFDQVVGALVREATARGRSVRAFGEMVALLWDAGDVPAAIELERMWNELGRQAPFTLLCAYRRASVSSPEDAEALDHVCALHSAVLHAGQAKLTGRFMAERDAPAAARHLALDALVEWQLNGTLLEDAQLVVTELATNAVIHAQSPFTLTVALRGTRVRIAVEDQSTARPVAREAAPASASGRGLTLVRQVASRWGVEEARGGKVVWAELST
jgi:anti-sigma regulatory factor (Ser/Thr protein kinase)